MRTAMSNETKKTGSSFMEKLSTVIVDQAKSHLSAHDHSARILRLFP